MAQLQYVGIGVRLTYLLVDLADLMLGSVLERHCDGGAVVEFNCNLES